MSQTAAQRQLDFFAREEARLSGDGPAWLAQARKAAIARFAARGFPGEKDEDWRFTKVDPIARTDFSLPAAAAPRAEDWRSLAFSDFPAYRLVFVNGKLAPALSNAGGLPPGVRIAGVADTLDCEPDLLKPVLAADDDRPFAALNAAFFGDGAVVWVPRDLALDKPVHLLFVSTAAGPSPVMWHGRVLVVAEPGAKASVVEEYVGRGEGVYFANIITELRVGENAAVEHTKLQREGKESFHVAGLRAHLERGAALSAHSISLGAALCRNDIDVRLEGEGADCSLDGLYLVGGRQHVDFHTSIDHAAAHCSSRELFKGVLDGSSRAVFNGGVVVRPGAQKTSAMVYNKNLLLSEQGLVNTKPEFKINANDVQCKHGATIGQLSPEALFYLRSRGIGAAEARCLLVYAFGREMVEKVPVAPLREALSGFLAESFGGGG